MQLINASAYPYANSGYVPITDACGYYPPTFLPLSKRTLFFLMCWLWNIGRIIDI
jgi:hypothetical protein